MGWGDITLLALVIAGAIAVCFSVRQAIRDAAESEHKTLLWLEGIDRSELSLRKSFDLISMREVYFKEQQDCTRIPQRS